MLRSLLRKLGLLRGTSAKAPASRSFHAGDLVSVVTSDGPFAVAKILAVDDVGVHIRLYAERFHQRPGAASVLQRSLGPNTDGRPFSAGHLPLTSESFARWGPSFIISEPVGHDELEGLRIWEEHRGGYF